MKNILKWGAAALLFGAALAPLAGTAAEDDATRQLTAECQQQAQEAGLTEENDVQGFVAECVKTSGDSQETTPAEPPADAPSEGEQGGNE